MRTAAFLVVVWGLTLAAHAKPIEWLEDFAQAAQLARKTGKPIFAWYYADT